MKFFIFQYFSYWICRYFPAGGEEDLVRSWTVFSRIGLNFFGGFLRLKPCFFICRKQNMANKKQLFLLRKDQFKGMYFLFSGRKSKKLLDMSKKGGILKE